LALSGVVRRWGERTVLDGASFQAEPGSITFLGGANGAGKTTLLRIAAGLISPHAGTVSLAELEPDRDRRAYARKLGWLPAGNGGIYNRLTVRQNLEYWVAIALMPRRAQRGAVHAAVESFELGHLQDRRADRISMGERQRLRLAMTFAHEPAVVLLDEPQTSLDELGLDRLSEAMAELGKRGGAAVWCAPQTDGVALPVHYRYEVKGGRVEPC